MKIDLNVPSQVAEILERVEKAGFEIYIVGGVVRDILLDRELSDWDFATNATPEDVLKLFGSEAFYDNKFGTVGVKNEGRPYEITTYRTEHGYSDNRRPDRVEWGKTLEDDLKRRDFTINALALKRVEERESRRAGEFELIDLHGGVEDLRHRLVRCVGDAHERFGEDALRMMRAVRIAATLGFSIEKATLLAIQAKADLVKQVSAERVRDELLKIMAGKYAADGYLMLKNSGLGREMLPEMEETFGVEQKSPNRHHIYDVGTHSVEALRHCPSPDAITRLATLVHDVGKARTRRVSPGGEVTFYNHEMESAKTAERIARRLRFSKDQADKFVKLVRWHQFTMDENITDSAVRRIIANVGKENVAELIALRIGDRIGSGAKPSSWRFELLKKRFEEVQKQPFSIPDLKIDGRDVMSVKNIPSGPVVGKYLQMLFAEVTENGLANEREILLNKLGEMSV